ncbi:FkbM family methyltransferase [Trichlorobacter lovleyi]|uniref:FkbM family methyltransferase n=1 Tax=Trichlorobacter lovleyi TaxID=313985 RepID=UPI00248076FE|nr:FkbM family methyltransferase [Trichlorobacter lovleyi]
MRLFGYRISLKLKIGKAVEPIRINEDFQKKVFGSNSQCLEDLHLNAIFRDREIGFYIDIGANDPVVFSNTKLFYERGWRGINIEPNIELYKQFCIARPLDINLNVGVGDSTGELAFYEMDPHTLSTFNKQEIKENVKKFSAVLVAERKVPVITLKEIFTTHVQGKNVDFISIDTEGFEDRVIAGNDWERNRPAILVMEMDHDHDNELSKMMQSKNYDIVLHNGLNAIFADRKKFL